MTVQDQTGAQLELALPIPSHHKPLRASPGRGSASPGYVPDDDEKMAKADEPMLVEHEPMFGREHQRRMKPWRQVPYPYQLGKWDGAWLFVLFLFAGGFAFKLLWLLAAFITFLRVAIWCSFRFPLATFFFTSVIRNLIGGRRRRRW